MTPVSAVAYLALFVTAGALFLAVHLLIGRLLRPNLPNDEKESIYECGEPTIGSSFVQFDLRFYVVALLFIIFDVEVAFFFPWAAVFGKSSHLMDPSYPKVVATAEGGLALSDPAAKVFAELGVPAEARPVPDASASVRENSRSIEALGRQLAWFSFADILVFFAVLIMGFAYVWRRGDLDWVRVVSQERARPSGAALADLAWDEEPALSA